MAQRAVGEIRAEVIVSDDVGGQVVPGSNMIRMRVDGVLGTTVTVLASGAGPQLAARRHPVRVLPRCPEPFFDREDETQQVLAELVARRSVALEAPPGMGMSTLVQHLAHEPIVTAIYGAVVCLSARGQTLDDLLQSLFTAFYTSDAPVRPTRDQLRHLLRPVNAAVFLDDVDLPIGALAELQELAPHCSFVLAGARTGEVRSVSLAGLHVDAAGQLLSHVLGHPVDRSAVYALWGLTRGAPTELIRLGTGAATYRGPLAEYVAMALQDALPPFTVVRARGPPPARPARRRAGDGAGRAAAGRDRRGARRRGMAAPVGRVRPGHRVGQRHLPVRGRRARPDGVAARGAPRGADRRVRDVGAPPPGRRPRRGCAGGAVPRPAAAGQAARSVASGARHGCAARRHLRPRRAVGRLALLPAGDAGGCARPRRPGRGGAGPAPAGHARARPR